MLKPTLLYTFMKPKVLVTAGPTWIKIDRVRIITNIFSGHTGTLVAEEFAKRGFEVRLLLGGDKVKPASLAGLKVEKFKYFEELKEMLRKKLQRSFYLAVIHTAAVSDYRLNRVYPGKIKSQRDELLLKLVPTPKLVYLIRTVAPRSFLVQFKLEVGKDRDFLIDRAYRNLLSTGFDLVVANRWEDIESERYCGYIIGKDKKVLRVNSRKELAHKLVKIVQNIKEAK